MPTIDNNQRLAALVKNAPSTTLHLIVGSGERGMVFFACEQAPLMTSRVTVFHHAVQFAVTKIHSEENRMLISKDNNGNIIGWRETYISKDEIVDVSVNGNINTITTRDRMTGKVDSKTFFGKPLLPSAFSGGNK